MKSTRILAWAIGCLSVAAVCSAAEADAPDSSNPPISISGTADYYSKYIWRGQNVNDESVFQPSLSLEAFGFTGSVWGSMDLTDENDNSGEFTEVDYSLDYTTQLPGLDWLDLSAGTVYYRFPNTRFESTAEVYAGAALACTCGENQSGHCLACLLAPSFRVFRDIDEIEGTYIQFGLGHTVQKVMRFSDDCFCDLQFGASLGYGSSSYNNGYFEVKDDALNDLTLTVGLPIQFPSFVLRPSINYSAMLDDEIRRATEHSDNLWGGVSLSWSF
jgi:hypothetical protein